MAYNAGTIFDNVGRLVYGDGSDGTLTYDGTTTILGVAPVSSGGRFSYTLTRDITAENITVNSTVDILTNGYRIYVRNKLTIQSNATINMNGGNASGLTAGTGFGNLGSMNIISIAGANGRTATGAAQNGLNAGPGPTSALLAATGGNGGAVTGGAGGTGGLSSLASLTGLSGTDWTYFFKSLLTATTGKVIGSSAVSVSGGPGGGGGAISGATGTSGGGGGGGGAVLICAYELDNSGTISADGGKGGNSAGGPTAAGGGGGGGGGWVSVVTRFITKQGTITANGGSAGGGTNQTIGATNGANGQVNILRV
jgi:hypothetical protein